MSGRVLFIASNYNLYPSGGSLIAKRNLRLLRENYEVDEVLLDFKQHLVRKLWDAVQLKTFGFTNGIKVRLKTLLKEKYEFVWVDKSSHGDIVRFLKKVAPDLKIVLFAHNVDYKYYLQKTKADGLQNAMLLPQVYRNELLGIRLSDTVVCLNKRDALLLLKFYNRSADLIFPVTFEDRQQGIRYVTGPGNRNGSRADRPLKALFVGSYFYANVHGLRWFVQEVLPHSNCNLQIVGKGMSGLDDEIKKHPKVQVRDYVDDLTEIYDSADFVVSPIFLGSGMKTKTGEALMFGKAVFGTTEAFEGYEIDFTKAGARCDTADAFIGAINNFRGSTGEIHAYNRAVFIEKYSVATEDRFVRSFKEGLSSAL